MRVVRPVAVDLDLGSLSRARSLVGAASPVSGRSAGRCFNIRLRSCSLESFLGRLLEIVQLFGTEILELLAKHAQALELLEERLDLDRALLGQSTSEID